VHTEIPFCFKELAIITTRGFFPIEDSLIVDMLGKNSCTISIALACLQLKCKSNVIKNIRCCFLGMKEKELEQLLKFDTKFSLIKIRSFEGRKVCADARNKEDWSGRKSSES